MAGTLEGSTVLEMGHVVAVPAAGATLADWGADVIKVEPLSGDMARGLLGRFIEMQGGDFNWYIHLLNRNKKGLALDLKTPPGRDILCQLVRRADVFLSNYEQSTLNKLKLDYTTLSGLNRRLVYGVLTGYGTAGPEKDERGFDYAAAWARAGMQYLIGEPGSAPPPQRGGMLDRVAAAHIVAGILAALLQRERTGRGQELQISLYHTGVWTLAEDIQAALANMPLPKHDRTQASNPLWNQYRTGDDGWLWLAMLQSDVSWPDFCRAIERPELENDPRFNTMETRAQNCQELIGILDEVFASRDTEEWERRLKENNCIYGRVASPAEVINDPQALANDFFADLHHPTVQSKVVTTPVKFPQNPASVNGPAPEVGQHTEDILLDLGYSWEDIAGLKEQGIIL